MENNVYDGHRLKLFRVSHFEDCALQKMHNNYIHYSSQGIRVRFDYVGLKKKKNILIIYATDICDLRRCFRACFSLVQLMIQSSQRISSIFIFYNYFKISFLHEFIILGMT